MLKIQRNLDPHAGYCNECNQPSYSPINELVINKTIIRICDSCFESIKDLFMNYDSDDVSNHVFEKGSFNG